MNPNLYDDCSGCGCPLSRAYLTAALCESCAGYEAGLMEGRLEFAGLVRAVRVMLAVWDACERQAQPPVDMVIALAPCIRELRDLAGDE